MSVLSVCLSVVKLSYLPPSAGMLPKSIVEQLKQGKQVSAESFDCVTIYFRYEEINCTCVYPCMILY